MKSLIISTVLLGLVAGSVVCQINPIKDRGFCPPPKSGIQGCLVKPETSCDTDDSCSKGQICCPNGCNRACQDPMKPIPLPEEASPGRTCPRINMGGAVVGICTFDPSINCLKDDDCSGGKLCCSDGCGKTCKDSVESRPPPPGLPVYDHSIGQCPKVASNPGLCVEDSNRTICINNGDCVNGQICCGNGCEKVCVDRDLSKSPPALPPRTFKSIGQCPDLPAQSTPCVADKNTTTCVGNIDCINGQICCGNGCEKVCVDKDLSKTPISLPPRPKISIGQCPDAPVKFGACVFDPSVNCLSNTNCSGGQICCSDGCNKICQDPDLSKNPAALPPRPFKSIGQCPDLPTPSGPCDVNSNTTTCVGNIDCSNGQICCGNGCEKVCVDKDLSKTPISLPPRPKITIGQCPDAPVKFGACVFDPSVNCVSNTNCSGGQICCSDGCNKICQDPDLSKNPAALPPRPFKYIGQCPDLPAQSTPCVADKNTTTCVGNIDCINGQICCGNGCEKVCVDKDLSKTPISLPPRPTTSIGQCPEAPVKFGACVFDPSVNCVSNTNCSGGQICCSDGCNKICQDPDLSKSPPALPPRTFKSIGQCPDLPTQSTPCVADKNTTTCVGNIDCINGQICCGNGCEKVCVDKDLSKTPISLPPRPTTSIGQCPEAPVKFGACVFDPSVNCLSNTNCSGGQICCSDGCNKICQDPDLSKSPPALPPRTFKSIGQCPDLPTQSTPCVADKNTTTCVGNIDCINGQICCGNGCEKVCVDKDLSKSPPVLPPWTFKSIGQCPNLPTKTGPCVADPTQTSCINNNDCSNDQICCGNGCEKICVDRDLSNPLPALPPRPIINIGQCPQGPYKHDICIYDESTHCLSNTNCTNGQICCSDGCNKVCQDPDLTKRPPALPTPIPKGPGICPPIPLLSQMGGCAFNPDKNCRGSGECTDGHICCSDGCNKTCQEPVGYLP